VVYPAAEEERIESESDEKGAAVYIGAGTIILILIIILLIYLL
jgi:hypothetical protein